MISIQCTPIQAARWDRFLLETAKMTVNGKHHTPISPKRIHACKAAYQKGGVCYVCKTLHMSRVTVIRILSDSGLV